MVNRTFALELWWGDDGVVVYEHKRALRCSYNGRVLVYGQTFRKKPWGCSRLQGNNVPDFGIISFSYLENTRKNIGRELRRSLGLLRNLSFTILRGQQVWPCCWFKDPVQGGWWPHQEPLGEVPRSTRERCWPEGHPCVWHWGPRGDARPAFCSSYCVWNKTCMPWRGKEINNSDTGKTKLNEAKLPTHGKILWLVFSLLIVLWWIYFSHQ